jgi:hypothetical protein
MPVGARRVVREAVHRDLHEIPRDRLGAGVVERAPDPAPVAPVGVRELGGLRFHNQAGARRQPLDRHRRVAVRRGGAGVPQFVVLPEPFPNRAAGSQHGLRPPGEVLRGLVPPSFDVADVRRVEAHPRGELLLRHSAFHPPLRKSRHEMVGGPLDGRGGHHRCPLRDETSSVAVTQCPQEATSALPTDTLTNRATVQHTVRSRSLSVSVALSLEGQLVRLALTRYGGAS